MDCRLLGILLLNLVVIVFAHTEVKVELTEQSENKTSRFLADKQIDLSGCIPSVPAFGDGLDNDCDSLIDEEIYNSEDDDRDGKIDEDLQEEHRDGSWGNWFKGSDCVAKCGETKGTTILWRRNCDSPSPSGSGRMCVGENTSGTSEPCVAELVLCPEMCSDYQWGYNCSNVCSKCATPCDSITGYCSRCINGWTSNTCETPCPTGCSKCLTNLTCLGVGEDGCIGKECSTGSKLRCKNGWWGDNCSKACNAACTNQTCRQEDGICLECQDGYWDGDCSQRCEECPKCSMDGSCLGILKHAGLELETVDNFATLLFCLGCLFTFGVFAVIVIVNIQALINKVFDDMENKLLEDSKVNTDLYQILHVKS